MPWFAVEISMKQIEIETQNKYAYVVYGSVKFKIRKSCEFKFAIFNLCSLKNSNLILIIQNLLSQNKCDIRKIFRYSEQKKKRKE